MTRKMAFAYVMTALTIVCLYGSVVLPAGKIALFAITSLCVLITHAECGTRFSLVQYVASAIIGALIVPFKFQIILFALFVGYYPIIKSYIERIGILWLEWLVKILFFNAVFIVLYFLLQNILLSYINLGAVLDFALSHLSVVIIATEIIFVLYDYMLSVLASYYVNEIKEKLKFIH